MSYHVICINKYIAVLVIDLHLKKKCLNNVNSFYSPIDIS